MANIGGYSTRSVLGPEGVMFRPHPCANALVIEMKRDASVVLYVLVLIAVVVSVDLLFFRNRFWERLIVNIGIVLVFAAFYLRFLKSP
jgi:hypothetical protein